MTPKSTEQRAGWALSRALLPFAKVEPDEAITSAILTLTVFVLLTAYYILKTAREPLILLHGGAEVKSYAAAGQAALLVLIVRVYGSVAKRVGPNRLLSGVYLFFAMNLLLFAVAPKDNELFGVAFYLWVGVFNYTSIAQFWALAADLYTPEQGARIFAVLGVGSSLGAVFGARIARALVTLGPTTSMLLAAALLVVCVLLLRTAARRERAVVGRDPSRGQDAPLLHEGVVSLLLRDRYLVLIAAVTLLLNWVNSTGEYLLDRTLLDAVAMDHAAGHAHSSALIGAFKADYFWWVNSLGVLVQLFLASRIIQRFGVRAALFVMPVVSLLGWGTVVALPVLSFIRLAKIAENSIDYSLQNTARQALYLVCSRVEKYVGKAAVDTVFVRLGDVLTAASVWAGTQLGATTRGFAAFNLALVAAWVLALLGVAREHRRRSELTPEEGLGIPAASLTAETTRKALAVP